MGDIGDLRRFPFICGTFQALQSGLRRGKKKNPWHLWCLAYIQGSTCPPLESQNPYLHKVQAFFFSQNGFPVVKKGLRPRSPFPPRRPCPPQHAKVIPGHPPSKRRVRVSRTYRPPEFGQNPKTDTTPDKNEKYLVSCYAPGVSMALS